VGQEQRLADDQPKDGVVTEAKEELVGTADGRHGSVGRMELSLKAVR
jgi:hypothetical protein